MGLRTRTSIEHTTFAFRNLSALHVVLQPLLVVVGCSSARTEDATGTTSEAVRATRQQTVLRAPAGELQATRSTVIDGESAAVLPNGRFVTPAGLEVDVTAPKPFGLALSPNGQNLATINSGSSRFSVSLIKNLQGNTPTVTRIDIDAAFMGVVFSPNGKTFYASGGENGNVWIGDTEQAKIVGSVNLNGSTHPLDRPLAVNTAPAQRFKGTFPGNMALSSDGKYLYVVDQGAFQVHVIDTARIVTGLDDTGLVTEPDNFAAVASRVSVGRYPFGLSLSRDGNELYVTHVGIFQYTHLRPENPTGDSNQDYPLCYPAVGYPDDTADTKTIAIKKVDPRNLPASQRIDDGIRCGYVPNDITYTVPGLGDPNVKESSSVYVLDIHNPTQPSVKRVLKPGLLVGQVEGGIDAYSGSHPNAVVRSHRAVYVANGNNDTVSVFDAGSFKRIGDISLADSLGPRFTTKGIQPVYLALSPDQRRLYVAEAGINAVAVVDIDDGCGTVLGHIPVGWWPSSVQVSPDGRTLYVANAKGRGAGPDNDAPPDNLGSPKYSTMGTVNIVPVPQRQELRRMTQAVLRNNGFVPQPIRPGQNPIPVEYGEGSRQIKHVIFINKENSTHDQMLGDITVTRKGVAVNGEPRYSLGRDASPNHHELALSYTFSDNFYLEPTVSSDGHRWLTGMYTTEMEETHWPASYGGRRRDSGDDPNSFLPYPGRIGFTDADGSPDPNDYNVHGGIYLHLARNGKSFVNFGNGFEFALVDEDNATEPTGIREHANIPMEKVVRDNSDHLFPEYNTHIPDAPLPEDPARFNRFGRFKQVFESQYVNRNANVCNLPGYVDLYYPNDHGGGANDIIPSGAGWSYKRFVQDNDAALGLTVELISHSPCWKDTVIFVVEDDTQNGLDHVDGYRSLFLAISPWVKREYVSKTHTSLASVFKTVELILGTPPLNQYDAAATDLRDMFTMQPDFSPYSLAPVAYASRGGSLWKRLTREIDFARPDLDEVQLQRAIRLSEGLPHRAKARTPGHQKAG
jgi:DNA-binding beta-propeller fold protein YncE